MIGGAIRRTFDATTHNRIANLDGVRETITLHIDPGEHHDFSECAARADHYVLLTDFGGAASMFEQRTPAVFEGHSLFDPAMPLKDKLRLGREMIDWMWANTKARVIYGITPVELRGARAFNRRVGFTSDGVATLVGEYWTHDMEYFHILRP